MLFSGKDSGQSLGLTQHQLHASHIMPTTALTTAGSYQPYPTQLLSKKHQHCKSKASTGALLIHSLCTFNSLLKQSIGVVQINDSNTQATARGEAARATVFYQVT